MLSLNTDVEHATILLLCVKFCQVLTHKTENLKKLQVGQRSVQNKKEFMGLLQQHYA